MGEPESEGMFCRENAVVKAQLCLEPPDGDPKADRPNGRHVSPVTVQQLASEIPDIMLIFHGDLA